MKRRSKYYIRNSSIKFLLLLVSIIGLQGCNRGQESIVILPSNFEGPVLILYDQPDGIIPKIENHKYIYEIPSNGLLKTKLKANFKVKGHEYYYLNNEGLIEKKITSVTINNNKHADVDFKINETYVFSDEMGTAPSNVRFRVFVIGKYNHKDSLLNLKDKFIINHIK